MTYTISKAQCLFTNGQVVTLIPETSPILAGGVCKDLEQFRSDLKVRLNAILGMLNIEVESIYFVYIER